MTQQAVRLKTLNGERGQTLVEYALILVLIAIGLIVAMTFMADSIGTMFSELGDTLDGLV